MSRPTYVYVVAGEGLGFVKIGIAYNADARVKQLQGANPAFLYVARRWGPFDRKTAEKIEAALHLFFDDFRAMGEWFSVRAEDVAEHILTAAGGEPAEVDAAKASFFEKVVHG